METAQTQTLSQRSLSMLKRWQDPDYRLKIERTRPIVADKKRKYWFTPEIDELIRRTYREDGSGKGQVNNLAIRLGIPHWKVSYRAREIGAYEPRIKEPNWSEKELKILERNAHHSPETIRKVLQKYGFNRSVTGILLKRRRMRMLKNLDGQSANRLAECFGVDAKVITRWIGLGYLKAKKRELNRTPQQGGNPYYIKDNDVRDFIIENIGLIDLRKVDKFWFVDVVANCK